MTQRFYLSLLIIIALNVTACQQVLSPLTIEPDNAAVIAAQSAEQSGDYLSASQLYLDLAKTVDDPQKSQFNLRAATAFWQLNQLEQVTTSLANVNLDVLSQTQQIDAAILNARMALVNSQAAQALAALSPFDLTYTPPTQKQQVLELRIQAYALTKNWLEKANSHILLDPLLSDSERDENQESLWFALMSLTSQALDLFNPGIPPAIDSGWFALAYLVKTYSTNPETFKVALEDWKRNYPNHPASPELYQKSVDLGTTTAQLKNLTDIAILLPETGPYKAAAESIKRGILAAHFNSRSNARLHFFAVDTDKQTGLSNVLQEYQRAVEQNASIVIGPLDKESLQILADADNLAIPVLALNRLANDTNRQNLFQFGLAPEDEAVAVADYAIKQNYRRALVLAPNNEWGSRIAAAFNGQWLQNGGILLNQANYNPNQNDFATTIKPLLGLQASEQRYASLRQRLGNSLEFEARRRQDVDFIFLVAKPLKARQLVPQLKFHRSGQLPIIATSHVYEGYDNSQQNIDLNNLVISDMPWVFNNVALSDPTYISLRNDSPEHFEEYVRLYALGADAYHLIPELNQLSRSPQSSFNGATGVLSINSYGQVVRKPRWAKFNRGLIELLPLPEPLTTVP
tara:strand:- start:2116 stop:4005 length:1890 start_codon:yes stop_codon:yes gene_type:complete